MILHRRLSFEEFKAWYTSQSLSAAAVPSRDIIMQSVTLPTTKNILDNARKLTKLEVRVIAVGGPTDHNAALSAVKGLLWNFFPTSMH